MKSEIVVILDRSGSMASIKSDMEGGFAQFIKEQRKLPDECTVTLVHFDSKAIETVYADKPVADVPPLKLVPRGSTPLLDAVGRTLTETENRLDRDPASGPGLPRVFVLVLTDGQENASREFTKAAVQELVKRLTGRGWHFLYLGANVDAFAEARHMGMHENSAGGYDKSAPGVKAAFDVVGEKAMLFRSGRSADLTPEDRKKLKDAGGQTECFTYEFEDVGGHLVLVVGATRALLDTGSPVTLGRQPTWEFLGAPRQLTTDLGPITMDALSAAIGTHIDVLLGTDLLSECAFDIDWPFRRVTFGGPLTGTGHAVSLTTRLGLPLATAKFGGEALQFVVDTGAVVSFLPQERLEGLSRIGSHRDFTVYPTVGPFETPLYRAPLMLGGRTSNFQWGALPDALAPLQLIATGIVGTELFRQYRVRFDLAHGTMWLSNVETT